MQKVAIRTIHTLELTLMNQANVTINKAQKITKGLTDGEIDLSEGYIAKLQKFLPIVCTSINNQPDCRWR